jgi:hypothetical protein
MLLNLDPLKKEDLLKVMTKYYLSIGRTETPKYQTYSLSELKKCVHLYRISSEFINEAISDN